MATNSQLQKDFMNRRSKLMREAREQTGKTMTELMRMSNEDIERLIGVGAVAAGVAAVVNNNIGTPNQNLQAMTTPAPVAPAPPPPVPVAPPPTGNSAMDTLLRDFAVAMQPYLDAKTDAAQVAVIAERVAENLIRLNKGKLDEDRVKELIEAAKLPRQTILTINGAGRQAVTVTGQHFLFKMLAYYAAKRRHCYLWGPPGGGKTTAAKTIADAEGLKFGAIQLNPQTPKSELFGFFAPDNKTYRRTLFRIIWEEGGIFLIDEIDNADDALLTTLNTALANDICTFPDAMVKRHPDFVCLATGNSAGRGGDVLHQSRRPLSGATLDRFISIRWDYDEEMEEMVAQQINPRDYKVWLGWVKAARKVAAERKLPVTISPRATFIGSEMLLDFPGTVEELADHLIFNKGVPPNAKETILLACPLPPGLPVKAARGTNQKNKDTQGGAPNAGTANDADDAA